MSRRLQNLISFLCFTDITHLPIQINVFSLETRDVIKSSVNAKGLIFVVLYIALQTKDEPFNVIATDNVKMNDCATFQCMLGIFYIMPLFDEHVLVETCVVVSVCHVIFNIKIILIIFS